MTGCILARRRSGGDRGSRSEVPLDDERSMFEKNLHRVDCLRYGSTLQEAAKWMHSNLNKQITVTGKSQGQLLQSLHGRQLDALDSDALQVNKDGSFTWKGTVRGSIHQKVWLASQGKLVDPATAPAPPQTSTNISQTPPPSQTKTTPTVTASHPKGDLPNPLSIPLESIETKVKREDTPMEAPPPPQAWQRNGSTRPPQTSTSQSVAAVAADPMPPGSSMSDVSNPIDIIGRKWTYNGNGEFSIWTAEAIVNGNQMRMRNTVTNRLRTFDWARDREDFERSFDFS